MHFFLSPHPSIISMARAIKRNWKVEQLVHNIGGRYTYVHTGVMDKAISMAGMHLV